MDECYSESATLAGGCFWCVEAVFDEVDGVREVVSGYSGGHVVQPTYEQVCSETTGHAEVVKVTFDTKVISYSEILKVFFSIHNPTTLNRQGFDIGASYRSAIFYDSLEQKITAESMIDMLKSEMIWDDPIVTEITALSEFYPAEDYHQDYYEKNFIRYLMYKKGCQREETIKKIWG